MERKNIDVRNYVWRYTSERERLGKGKITVKRPDGLKEEVIIRPDNLKVVLDWLDFKYQRMVDENGHSMEKRVRYSSTMCKYVAYLRNVLFWFNHKPLKDLTEQDLTDFYRSFESGEIKTHMGKELTPNSKVEYYKKIFRGEHSLFGLNHLNKNQICRKVMLRNRGSQRPTRPWFRERELNIILQNSTEFYRCLFGTMFDTGIEISAMVQLTKDLFTFEDNKENWTYRVHVPIEISKKGRQLRDMIIVSETTKGLLRRHLEKIKDGERVFPISPDAASLQLKRIVDKFGLKVYILDRPIRDITLKDFRSSNSIYLLNMGFTTEQIKRRLGHSPSSTEIDNYLNLLGLKDEKEKELVNNYEIGKLVNRLDVLEKFIQTFFDGLDIKNMRRDQSGNLILRSKPIMIKTDGNVIPKQGVITFDHKGFSVEMDGVKMVRSSLPIGSKVEKIEEFYGEG